MKDSKAIYAITLVIASTIGFYSLIEAAANFELFNKSYEGVIVKLEYGDKKEELTINPGDQKQSTVDANQPLYLTITGRASNKRSDWKITDRRNKTRYITYNPTKKPYLYPQTGPLMGFLGKTESGLSLSNNIKQSDIYEIIP